MDEKRQPAPGRRRYWVAVFVAVSLALIGGGYAFYRSEAAGLGKERYRELKTIAGFKADQIRQWRLGRLSDGERISKSPFFARGLGEWLANPAASDRLHDLKERLGVERTHGQYSDVRLISTEGSVLLSLSNASEPSAAADARATEDAMQQRKAVLSELFRGRDGRIYIDTAAPVFDRAGRPLAIIILRSNADTFLYPLIQSWPTLSRTAETLVVAREGDDVLFLNSLRHRADAALALRYPLVRKEIPAVQAVSGRTGMFLGKDYRKKEVMADLRPIPGSPWFMVAKVDTSEILAEARYRAGIVSFAVVVLILLAALATSYVYRHREAFLYRTLYHSEREQRESQELFRTTLYSIGDAVITTDGEGRVRHMNRVAEHLTGWLETEAQVRPLTEIFKIINEKTFVQADNPVERVLREGSVIGLANHTVLISRNGDEYPIADSGAPIRDEGGAVIGVVMVFRDQTEERRAEEEMRESKTRLDLALQSASMGAWHWDILENRRFFDDQVCALLGIDQAAFRGTEDDFFGTVHPDDRGNIKAALAHSLEMDVPYESEYRAIWPDGSVRYISGRGRLVRDELGRPVRMCGIVWDTTDRKLMEEALRTSVHEKEILIKEIHHRVKNNLNVIISLLNLQSQRIESKEQAYAAFHESRDRIYSMALIHQKLYQTDDLSRIDMEPYIRDISSKLMHIYAPGGRIAVETHVKGVSLDVNVAVPLGLILNEGITNAVKHAFPDNRPGRIEVSLAVTEEGWCRLLIEDDGVGLPAGIQPETADSLGLELIRILAEQIEGILDIQRSPGTGITITFPYYNVEKKGEGVRGA